MYPAFSLRYHDIDPAGLDVRKELLEGGSLHRAAGDAAVVVAGPDQPPALPGLTLDVGLAGLALGIERVEVPLQALLGGFAGVDRAMRAVPSENPIRRGNSRV